MFKLVQEEHKTQLTFWKPEIAPNDGIDCARQDKLEATTYKPTTNTRC